MTVVSATGALEVEMTADGQGSTTVSLNMRELERELLSVPVNLNAYTPTYESRVAATVNVLPVKLIKLGSSDI